jgi:hypothetical protein
MQLDRQIYLAYYGEVIVKQQTVIGQNAAGYAVLYSHHHIIGLVILQGLKCLFKRAAFNGSDILSKKLKGRFLVKRCADALYGYSWFNCFHNAFKAKSPGQLWPGLFSLSYMFVSAY